MMFAGTHGNRRYVLLVTTACVLTKVLAVVLG